MNVDNIWENILGIICQELAPISFNTWFKNTSLLSLNDSKAIIKVPMQIHKKLLGDSYYELIDNMFFKVTGKNYDIEFVCEEDLNNTDIQEALLENNGDLQAKHTSNLLKKYTFDNFIVGKSNRFAHAAALAVAQSPGKVYNPLFIYGKSGLGKTHLMHAIGNYIEENNNKKVLYITSDEFRSDFTNLSNPNNENNFEYVKRFKEKYRNIDVLIIDDIQFLAGAEKTQNEFFHTYETLWKSEKQIIISSDKNPDDLKAIENRLLTRFVFGLTVNIEPPDFELKCNLIKNKIFRHDVAKMIDNDVIEFMANNCENDVRHIEGAITRIYAYAAINNPPKIDLQFTQEALKDYINKTIYLENDIVKIQNAVAKYYNINIDDFKSKKKSNNIAYPRQLAMYLCRMMTDNTLQIIGLEFGGRNHATVLHAYDRISKDLKTNKQLQQIINTIKNNII